MSTHRHEGKTVLITGGARGIGRAYAERFAADGANVVIADMLEAEGRETVADLEKTGAKALFVTCNVTDEGQCNAMVEAAMKRFGRLDTAIANAGVGFHSSFLDYPEDKFEWVYDVNAKGAFLTGRAAARAMIAGGKGGAIINIASVNALLANENNAPYGAGKAAVVLLTKVMAVTLADHGIRVNAIAPGPTKTAMEAKVMADPVKLKMRTSRTPLRRLAETAEVAGVASFLASDDASFVTGQTIYVDGGRLALNYFMSEEPGGMAGTP